MTEVVAYFPTEYFKAAADSTVSFQENINSGILFEKEARQLSRLNGRFHASFKSPKVTRRDRKSDKPVLSLCSLS